jgi:hypothetical protein
LALLFTLIRHSNSTAITTLSRSLIIVNTTVIITANTRLIAFIDKVGINKAIAAKTDIKALATTEEALMEGTVKNRQPTKRKNC